MSTKPTYKELEQKLKELQERGNRFKSNEKALSESEERYRIMFENAQVGLFRSSISESKLLSCNKFLARKD